MEFTNRTNKKSINERDVLENNGKEVPSKKKRVRFSYDINYLIEEILKGD